MAKPFTTEQLDAMPRDEVNLRLQVYMAEFTADTATDWYSALTTIWRDFCKWLYWELPPNTTALCGAYTYDTDLCNALAGEIGLTRNTGETNEQLARRCLAAINNVTDV